MRACASVVKWKPRTVVAFPSTVGNLRFIACQPAMQNHGCFTKFRANQLKENSPFPTHLQCKHSVPITAHPYSSSLVMAGSFLWSAAAKSPFQALCEKTTEGINWENTALSWKEKTIQEGKVKYRAQFRDKYLKMKIIIKMIQQAKNQDIIIDTKSKEKKLASVNKRIYAKY